MKRLSYKNLLYFSISCAIFSISCAIFQYFLCYISVFPVVFVPLATHFTEPGHVFTESHIAYCIVGSWTGKSTWHHSNNQYYKISSCGSADMDYLLYSFIYTTGNRQYIHIARAAHFQLFSRVTLCIVGAGKEKTCTGITKEKLTDSYLSHVL